MNRNVGNGDRVLRGIAVMPLVVCSMIAPWPLSVRLLACGLPAAYLAFTALAGFCAGYKIMGRSTCAVGERR